MVTLLLVTWSAQTIAADVAYSVRGAEQSKVATLGSARPTDGYKLEVDLSAWGASVMRVRLADYRQTALGEQAYEIQTAKIPGRDGQTAYVYPYAAKSVTINGQTVDLAGVKWELIEPATFRTSFDREPAEQGTDVQLFARAVYRVSVVDADGREVLEIQRIYELAEDSYDLRCRVELLNKTDAELELVWDQLAQGDAPTGTASYLGDRRLLVAGYRDLDYNPSGEFIYTDKAYLSRKSVVDGDAFWPNDGLPQQRELVWFASLNRYFTVVTHPVWDPNSSVGDHPGIEQTFKTLSVEVVGAKGNAKQDQRRLFMRLHSAPIRVAAGGAWQLTYAMYAGPRRQEVFAVEPYATMSFTKLIKYELGCTFCTFQPLARGLLGFLKFLHMVVRDWAVSIVILVLCVRLLLHPITKRAQINMMKMGKQMKTLQPEIEKLKNKYKDDKQKFQQEQVKLWREKGMNPANMLGCLPMFLQSPIWIALYAMLYFAIELRHEQAFYGVFQKISGGAWGFLGDLSSPDSFVTFAGEGFTLPLGFINPTFSGINLLPILMGGVFFVQQKLTSPPAANEQAAQQQKIMQIMMIFLFPVMLYSAPSGLTLYILASTFAGIVDSYIVRRHIKAEEEAGTLFDKKPRKEGGFWDRVQKTIATKQQGLLEQQASAGSKRKGKSRGGSGGGRRKKR